MLDLKNYKYVLNGVIVPSFVALHHRSSCLNMFRLYRHEALVITFLEVF